MDDIEVEGTFISTANLDPLTKQLNVVGQNVWENMKKRLTFIIQRPYQQQCA